MTFDISNFDKSIEVKELQYANIACIVVTLDVLKLDTLIKFILLIYLNIKLISVTDEVSKLVIFKNINDSQS